MDLRLQKKANSTYAVIEVSIDISEITRCAVKYQYSGTVKDFLDTEHGRMDNGSRGVRIHPRRG